MDLNKQFALEKHSKFGPMMNNSLMNSSVMHSVKKVIEAAVTPNHRQLTVAEEKNLRSALIHFGVYVSGAAVVVALYLNYLLLSPYFAPLFWAIIISIPLHELKSSVLEMIEQSGILSTKKSFFSGLRKILRSLARQFMEFIFGRKMLDVLFSISSSYVSLLSRIFNLFNPTDAKIETHKKTNSNQQQARLEDQSIEEKEIKTEPISNNQPKNLHFKKMKSKVLNLDGNKSESMVIQSNGNKSESMKSESMVIQSNGNKSESLNGNGKTEKTQLDGSITPLIQNKKKNFQFKISQTPQPLDLEEKPVTTTTTTPENQQQQQQNSSHTHHEQSHLSNRLTSTHSGIYFLLLFRCCTLYFLWLFFSSLNSSTWIVVGIVVGSLFLLSILFAFIVGFLKHSIVGAAASGIFEKLESIFSALFSIQPISSIGHGISFNIKNFLNKNKSGLVALGIIGISVVGSLVCSTVLIFAIAKEANGVLVEGNNLLSGLGVGNKAEDAFQTFSNATITWLDTKLKENNPNMNTSELISRLDTSFAHFKHVFSGNPTNISTTARLGFFEDLPHTNSLMNGIAGGLIWELTTKNLTDSIAELKNLTVNAIKSFFNVSGIEEVIEKGDPLSYASTIFFTLSSGTLNIVSSLGFGIFALSRIFFGAFGLMFNFILFFSCLYYLLSAEKSVPELFQALLSRQDFIHAIQNSVNEVLLTSIRMCVFHTVFTWLTFSIANVPNLYMNTCLAGFLALMPFVSVLFTCVPACIHLAAYIGIGWQFWFVLSSQFFVWWFVDEAIYQDIPDSHPLIMGLSLVLGFHSYGMYGLLIGPLLAIIPVIAFKFVGRLNALAKQ